MRIAIIGAGPIGLYFASLCEKENIDYTIFEATESVGGQLAHLYPEKLITNIPNIESISAVGYINELLSKVQKDKILLNNKITSLNSLHAQFDAIVVATGIGEYQPRTLGIANETDYNILYSLTDYQFLKDKNVVIFGGGDSALDWAKQLSSISNVVLVHRRDEFRGNADTIKDCNLNIYLSYVPDEVAEKAIKIKSVKTAEIITLPYDYILVNFGQIHTKTRFESLQNVYYVGDASGSKTIADGIQQADCLFSQIKIS